MLNKPLASIDLGTNTFRLLIANVYFDDSNGVYLIKEIVSERIITRLGAGLSRKGFLKKDVMDKSLSVLGGFSKLLSEYSVSKVSAVATSALRLAKNSNEFLRKAKESAGLDIRIISGEDEAKITASGMLVDIPAPGSALLVDIGGGSTELIFVRHGIPSVVKSLDLGVVYLADRYMKHDPPLKKDLMKMERHISGEIEKNLSSYSKLVNQNSKLKTVFIGTAGSITTLAAVSRRLKKFEHKKIHNTILTRRKVKSIYDSIASVSSCERGKFIPFEPSRLDIIVPGTLILLKLMEAFRFPQLTVSNYGLREGLIVELYERSKKRLKGHKALNEKKGLTKL